MSAVVTVFGLVPRYIGGSENYGRELSLQLASHGWKSVLCFLKQPPDDVLGYLDLPNTEIEVLENSDSPRPGLSTIKKLSQILRTHRANVLHLHLVGFVSPYPWLARACSVQRVFFTNHMSQQEGYLPRRAPLWKRRLVRVLNWPMSGVICVSDYNYRCLTALDLLPKERFKRVYNGIDFSRIADPTRRAKNFRARYGIPSGRTLIVQVCWMIRDKGVGDLLEAAQLVMVNNRDCHFAFVGEGADRAAFMKKAIELGLGDHVTWTGLIQDPFAEGVYDGADIVCQPSRWEEAFGQVIAEAMACNKPVIGTRVGGIPEVIDDGKAGFLVDRGDTAALAEKILLLASDVNLRNQMGQAGRLLAERKFDLKTIVSDLINLYGVVNLSTDAGDVIPTTMGDRSEAVG